MTIREPERYGEGRSRAFGQRFFSALHESLAVRVAWDTLSRLQSPRGVAAVNSGLPED